MAASTPSYTVALLGNGGVGKTSFLRALDDTFLRHYIVTLGISESIRTFNTNRGPITLTIRDYAGQEKYKQGLNSSSADLSVVMYDVTSVISYKHARTDWNTIAGTSPIMYVANKCDIAEQYVSSGADIRISCKNRPNSIRACVQSILRRLTNDDELVCYP